MFLWRPGLWKKGQLVVLQIEAICGSGGIPAFARTTIFLFHTLGVLSHVCEFFVTIYNFSKLQAILFVAQGDPSIYATILGALFYIMIFLKSFHICCCDSCFCQNDNLLFSQFSKFSHLWLRFFNFDRRYAMKLSEQEDGLKTCFHGRRPFCEKPDRISGPFRRQMSNSRTEICEE